MTFALAILFTSHAFAEGKKLADKLSQGTLVISAEIKGCEADEKKYCPGLPPGSKKSFMCLMAYEEKISNECKMGIMEAAIALRQGMEAIDYSIKACEADADKFCLDVQPGEGRLINCIKKHESKVSQACTSALKQTGLWGAAKK